MTDTNNWELWFSVDKGTAKMKHTLGLSPHTATLRIAVQRVILKQHPETNILKAYVSRKTEPFEDMFDLCFLKVVRENSKSNWKIEEIKKNTLTNYARSEKLTKEMFDFFIDVVQTWWKDFVAKTKAADITKLFRRSVSPGLNLGEAIITHVTTELKPTELI